MCPLSGLRLEIPRARSPHHRETHAERVFQCKILALGCFHRPTEKALLKDSVVF